MTMIVAVTMVGRPDRSLFIMPAADDVIMIMMGVVMAVMIVAMTAVVTVIIVIVIVIVVAIVIVIATRPLKGQNVRAESA